MLLPDEPLLDLDRLPPLLDCLLERPDELDRDFAGEDERPRLVVRLDAPRSLAADMVLLSSSLLSAVFPVIGRYV